MTVALFENTEAEVRGLLDHVIPGRWMTVTPGAMAVTETGVGYLYHNEKALIIGFGLRCSLPLSRGLIDQVHRINRYNGFLHAWLTPGDDELDWSGREDADWSVMLGAKVAYSWMTPESLRQYMYTMLTNQETALRELDELVAPFGGRKYWSPHLDWSEESDPTKRVWRSGLMLMAHLGIPFNKTTRNG